MKKNDPCKIGIILTLYSGVRIGELCALKWENINLINGIIKITATLQRIPDINGESDKKNKNYNNRAENSLSETYYTAAGLFNKKIKMY